MTRDQGSSQELPTRRIHVYSTTRAHPVLAPFSRLRNLRFLFDFQRTRGLRLVGDHELSLMSTDESEDSLPCCSADFGADRDRTGDPRLAKPVLSQLSYSPVVGTAGSSSP